MSEQFVVRSRFHDYTVGFSDGLLADLEALLEDGDVIVLDRAVRIEHAARLDGLLTNWPTIEVHASEKAKSFEEIGRTIAALVSIGFRKSGRLLVIGGGVTQDISAFIATIIYRGVDWFFVPTTLLAQGDSCIGGKSSINFRGYKNLLGSFRPPARILIDVAFLETLPAVEICSGVGEILHFLVCAGEEDFEFLEANIGAVHTDSAVTRELIRRSLSIKKAVIEVDEVDVGVRQLFNYGHSFGHAIEAVTDYAIPHGIAVSFGVDIANYLSVRLGMAEPGFRKRVRDVAAPLWEGFSIKDLDVGAIFSALRRDKKNIGPDVYVILTSGFGGCVKTRIDLDERDGGLIRQYFAREAM